MMINMMNMVATIGIKTTEMMKTGTETRRTRTKMIMRMKTTTIIYMIKHIRMTVSVAIRTS